MIDLDNLLHQIMPNNSDNRVFSPDLHKIIFHFFLFSILSFSFQFYSNDYT